MKTRHVDAATSPHTYSSTPNIFFSILLLPEKANVKEFTKTYQKEGDFYFIQGAKKKKEKKAKSHETIRSQESFCSRSRSRSECCSVCSCCDFDRCHSSLRFEDQEPRQSNSKGLQFYAIEGRRPRSSCAVNFECVECNNNCNAPENCPKKVSQSDEIEVIVENGDEVDRRNSELIKQELLMRDALRKELLKSCSNEPRYEGCFKKSIPCLITPAAIIFCLLNFFIPGSGSIYSSHLMKLLVLHFPTRKLFFPLQERFFVLCPSSSLDAKQDMDRTFGKERLSFHSSQLLSNLQLA